VTGKTCLVMALICAAIVGGCAAQDKNAGAPSAPDRERERTAAPPTPSVSEDRDAPEGPRAALARAKGDLDRAEREILASAGDCASACRALASMERATGHLCALGSSDDDRSRCDEAKTKVLAARERVRSTCGVCEGGPSLDRTAPIPSVRP
jgi:hypothetical protein